MLDRKKENNTACSSINLPRKLVNNVGFNVKLKFPDFVTKSSEHCYGDIFTRWWEHEEEWFWRFENLFKAKIKISIICVSKEFEIKKKMVKPCIYIYVYIYIYYVYNTYYKYHTYTYIKELCQQVFIYNEEAPYTSHRSCAKVAILLLPQFEHFVRHRYIWYIFSLVCSVFVIQQICFLDQNLLKIKHKVKLIVKFVKT